VGVALGDDVGVPVGVEVAVGVGVALAVGVAVAIPGETRVMCVSGRRLFLHKRIKRLALEN
jgi:hypothetical protein